MRYLYPFLFCACLIDAKDHAQTLSDLNDYLSETEQDDDSLPPSTHQLVFEDLDACILFPGTDNRADIPLHMEHWSFSFLLAPPLAATVAPANIDPPKIITFARGNSYLSFQAKEEDITFTWCNEDQECLEESFSPPSLSIGDRITFAYGEPVLNIYHNASLLGGIESESQFTRGNPLRFGCFEGSSALNNTGWIGGIDTLVLLSSTLTPADITELSNSSTPHLVLSEYETIFGYWNLGENGSDSVIDLRGNYDGAGINTVATELDN